MKRRWWILIPVVLIGLVYGGARLVKMRAQAATGAAAVTYSPVKVVRGSLSITVDASGTITAANSAEIFPSRDGEVTKVLVEPGDMVKAGQLLVLMDAADAEAILRQAQDALYVAQVRLRSAQNSDALARVKAERDLDEARAAVASARSNLQDLMDGPDPGEVAQAEAAVNQAQLAYDAAKAEYDRMKRLFEAQAVTKKDLDDALQSLQSKLESLNSAQAKLRQVKESADAEDIAAAEAALAKAQKNLAIAEANLRTAGQSDEVPAAEANLRKALDDLATAREDAMGMKLVAPFDGVITEVNAVVGTTYVATKTADPLVSMAAPGKLVAEVEVNEADINQVAVGQEAEITMNAAPDETFHGKVITVGGLGHEDQGVHYFTVRIAITDANNKIKPGMTADAVIMVAHRPDALSIPNGAIETRMGRTVARIYKSDGTVEYRRVTTGLRTDTATEILDGLREGETVAVPGTATTTNTGNSDNGNRRPQRGRVIMFGGPPRGR